MLQEFSLQFGHVNIGWTLTLAGLAAQTKAHHIIDFLVVIPVLLVRMRQEFPQDIGTGACCIFLIARGHVRGAHGSAREMGFSAIS